MARAVQIDMLLAGLRDSSGDPLAGGKVYTYVAGTTTDLATFTEQDQSLEATNPIILDSRGAANVYGNGAYKFKVTDADDVEQYTWDNLNYSIPEDNSIYAGTSTGSSNAYAVTPSPAVTSYNDGDQYSFVANHASSGAATFNVSALGAKSLVAVDGSTAITTGDILDQQLCNVIFVAGNDHFRLTSKAGVQAISAGGTGASTAAGARTSLGLGTMATQNANSVNITGGAVVATSGTFTGSTVTVGELKSDGAGNLEINAAGSTEIQFQNDGSTVWTLNNSGKLVPDAQEDYTTSFPTYNTTRDIDKSAATLDDVVDVLKTLIADLQTLGLLG